MVRSGVQSPRRARAEGTARLVATARRAGVSHIVYSSIVGVDAIPWPYLRKKLAAEQHVPSGQVPWSIVRATQFFPPLDGFLTAAARLPIVPGPTDVPGRPVDPHDFAEELARQIAHGPSLRVESYAGPETLSFGELADQWLAVRGRRERAVRLPIPGTSALSGAALTHGYEVAYYVFAAVTAAAAVASALMLESSAPRGEAAPSADEVLDPEPA